VAADWRRVAIRAPYTVFVSGLGLQGRSSCESRRLPRGRGSVSWVARALGIGRIFEPRYWENKVWGEG